MARVNLSKSQTLSGFSALLKQYYFFGVTMNFCILKMLVTPRKPSCDVCFTAL